MDEDEYLRGCGILRSFVQVGAISVRRELLGGGGDSE